MKAPRVLLLGVVWLAGVLAWAFAANGLAPSFRKLPDWPRGLLERVVPLARWDSGWYLGLAEHGYESPPERIGQQTNHAFFPLYPALTRALSRATGLETSRAGTLISVVSLLGALLLFASYVERRFGRERARPAILLLLLFPTAFFFAAVYSEALLVFLSLASIVAMERRRPVVSALAGFLAGLTRVSGLVLVPYLFLVALRARRERGDSWGRAAALSIGVALAPLAGFAALAVFFWRRFDDPFLFVAAQHNWAQAPKTIVEGPALIWTSIVNDLTTGHVFSRSPVVILDGLILLLFLILGIGLARRRLYAEAVYVVATCGIVLLSGTLESGGRYVLPAFPAFAQMAGIANRPRLFRVWLGMSALMQAGYVFLFVHGRWAG